MFRSIEKLTHDIAFFRLRHVVRARYLIVAIAVSTLLATGVAQAQSVNLPFGGPLSIGKSSSPDRAAGRRGQGHDQPPRRSRPNLKFVPQITIDIEIDGRRPSRDRRVSCDGGRVSHGTCVCPKGSKRIRHARRVYECEKVVDQARISCEGGRVIRAQCICPSGTVRERNGKRDYSCEKTSDHADIACKGGIVKHGKCLCGPGRRYEDGVCERVVVDVPPAAPPATAPPAVRPPLAVMPPIPVRPPVRTAVPPIPPAPATVPPQQPALAAEPEFEPDQILVSLPSAVAESVEDAFAQNFNLQILQRRTITLLGRRYVLLRIPDGRNVPQVLAAVAGDPRISTSQENKLYRYLSDSSGSSSPASASATAGTGLQYALEKLDMISAHRVATGRGRLIAVIDTGIDPTHSDLAGLDVEEIDATSANGSTSKISDGHGTAIAGILSARGVTRGVAPGARLLSVKAFRDGAAGKPATTTTFILISSLDAAAAKGAQILNMSFAGPQDSALHDAIQACAKRRIMAVAAAGNHGAQAKPAYPAAYPEVIAVTATDASDKLYAKANHGSYISIAAPGVDLLVPALANAHQLQSGTSFAAAYVSGILALMLERDPALSPQDARRTLEATAIDLGAPGPDKEFGAGRADARAALSRLPGLATAEQTPQIVPASATVKPGAAQP